MMQTFKTDEARWQAVTRRDHSADGQFVFAVTSTGIYCRPGCPARTPKRENVVYFRTADAAEAAGFRPCKRCHPASLTPKALQSDLIADICTHIDHSDPLPSVADLAEQAGMSIGHFQRTFRAVTGITPKTYLQARRDRRFAETLQQAERVTDAVYDAGFGSTGRAYDRVVNRIGMAPSAVRRGGAGVRLAYAVAPCALGVVLVARSQQGVAAIELGDSTEAVVKALHDRFPNAEIVGDDTGFGDLLHDVAGLIETPERGHSLPLDIQGTVFQRRVWQALQDIPAGETRTYSQLAKAVGRPKAVRAVAGACAANAHAVAIPCHRIVRSDSSISGYRWGRHRKKVLLAREKTEKAEKSRAG